MNGFRLPNITERLAIIGRTGSGKTQFGAWVLSQSPFDKIPYIIVDYKGDDLLGSSDKIIEIGLNEKLPKQPGLYIIRPLPHQQEQVEDWFWKVWQNEKTGLYIDEGYAIPDKGAFTACLTQGRSKKIPIICLTQRPSWISRFVFSEANYYAIFHLNDENDKKRVQAFVPKDRLNVSTRLPEYECAWYDVMKDKVFHLLPAPSADMISETFDKRLKSKRKMF